MKYSDALVRHVRECVARGGETDLRVANAVGISLATLRAWVKGWARVEAGGPIRPKVNRQKAENGGDH